MKYYYCYCKQYLSLCLVMMSLFGIAKCDIDKDKEKCGNVLIGLATCLPYVSGESNAPPTDCCSGLKQVLQTSRECICLLVKDRNDPSLGLQINATRALSLPTRCNAPITVNDCIALLHLSPNSPDAKVFQDFANSANTTTNATATPPAASAAGNSTYTIHNSSFFIFNFGHTY
ncbi:hypothetical protein RD792_003002 [Penstemon davidsonii]|uniref:Bifunctional inhibitor/plant lipid transfer protein/seed storage helical domain-containing protein n=1 Tax=Penstemon davidsonii TaxID=160366 RepID=A0ABR0DTI5_9LAMI|nr:hypothetical protein RD792_003002 [Penstemon davidsonii]